MDPNVCVDRILELLKITPNNSEIANTVSDYTTWCAGGGFHADQHEKLMTALANRN